LPEALIFDLDGTLVDSAPDMARAMDSVLSMRGYPSLPIQRLREFVGNGVSVLVRLTMAEMGAPEADFPEWQAAYLAAYADCICVDSRPYPGVAEALDALRGHPMAVCTNKPQALAESLLDALDMRFPVVLGGDTSVGRKPSAAPLLHVAQALKVGRALMIGDSGIDAAAARAAGMPLILFTGGYRDMTVAEIAPDAAFDDWRALPDLIRGRA